MPYCLRGKNLSIAGKEANTNKDFEKKIERKEKRKHKAREERDRSLWFGLGMFGLVGWSVAIPTLIFLALGLWLDARTRNDLSFTLMFLVLGVALGCLNAWYWVKRESRKD